MASDLSFNIVALDRASATFVKVAEQLDRISAKVDKLDGKNATVDVKVKTDESQKALDSFSNRWALLASTIVAGSPLIGAAIIGGVGAGFIGMAALAQKGNEQVQQTYKTLWSNVVTDTKQATSSLVPILVASGNQIGQTFERLGPLMQRGFAAAGPQIEALTRGVTSFATNAMPGMISMVEHGQVVFTALGDVAGKLGSAVGRAFSDIGSNAAAISSVISGLGNILSTALGLAVSLMNSVAQVWARSGAQITAALQGIADVAAGLATGAIPVLSAALSAAAQIVTALTSLLSPMSGALGFIATAALAAWAALKGAEVVSGLIRGLSGVLLSASAAFDGVRAKAAAAALSFRETGAATSVAATGLRATSAAASTASFSFAAAAESLAGPLGLALAGITVAMGLFAATSSNAESKTMDFKAAQDSLTAALEQSDGAISSQVISTLMSQDEFKKAADAAKQFGITQQELVDAITKGGPSLDAIRDKLTKLLDAHHAVTEVNGKKIVAKNEYDDVGQAIKSVIDGVTGLAGAFGNSQTAAANNSAALQQHTAALLTGADAEATVKQAADATGLSVDAARAAFQNLGTTASNSSGSLQDLAFAFAKASLATANAAGQIATTFKQADQQVTQSSQAVKDAQHGVAQASQAVADAQHGEAQAAQQVAQAQQGVAAAEHGVQQAQRSLRDAIEAVSQAQYQYTQSLRSEKDAEQALSDARQQAVRDIQAVHDALANSQTSEQNARLSLFNAQQTAAGLGITDKNASAVANGPITAANKDQVKAAIDLISAQNQLAQSTTQLTYAKQDTAAADKAGVEGSKGVVSAERSLVDAQRSVQDSLRAVQKAQQGVSDASYGLVQAQQGLQRAQQAVTDAAYAQRKAHQAVVDAQYAQQRASQQLTTAQDNLKNAQDNASRSLDLNTEAGRRNLGQLFALTDAIKNQFGPTQQGYQKMVEGVAAAFGLSKDKAEAYLKQLGLIDPNFKFSVTGVTQVDMTPLADWAKDPSGYFKGGFLSAGGRIAMATGGHVRGPGTETSDEIPAWLSNNEYVHKADAVNFWGVDFMDDINNRRIPKTLKFADGGLVQNGVNLNLLAAGYGTGYEFLRNISIMTGADPSKIPQLPAYVPPPPMDPGSNLPYYPGSGVARWSNVALQAMGMLGIPPNFLGDILRRMNQESGGNPTIVNRWDSNWQKGTPSVGLMQVIGPTFRSNAGQFVGTGPFSYGVSVDPLANIYAGLNYAGGRYGGGHGGFLGGVIYAMNKPGGYDNGGELQPGWTPVFNGTGKPENVRTSAQEDAIVDRLDRLAERVDNVANRVDKLAGRPAIAYVDRNAVARVAAETQKQAELESGMV